MRKTFTLISIVATLFTFTNMSFGQTTAPNMGTTANFALFSISGALSNNGPSLITGDIGNTTGIITGFGGPPTEATVTGSIRGLGSPESGSAATDVTNLYTSLFAAPCGTIISPALGGQTLVSSSAVGSPSGVFCQGNGAATNLAANQTLTLSGDGIFIIQISNTLITGASSSIVLTNGATADKVFFQVVDAVTLGAGSTFRGTIVAAGAITGGASASVTGRFLSTAGAISLDNNVITKVGSPPVASPPIITNLAASPSPVCAGSPITFTATVGNAAPPYAFTITNGSNTVSGNAGSASFTRVLTASGSGPQVYTLTVSNVGAVGSATAPVTVNPLPTVVLTFPGGTTVVGPNTGTATITLPSFSLGQNFQATGGVFYERLIIIDRINGYEIRQTDSNSSGVFPINRGGPFTLTVTDGNGCQRTVAGVIQFQPQ